MEEPHARIPSQSDPETPEPPPTPNTTVITSKQSRRSSVSGASVRPGHTSSTKFRGASMVKVYSRAAKLIQRTLDVDGVIVIDVSNCDVLDPLAVSPGSSSTPNAPASNSSMSWSSSSTHLAQAGGLVPVTMYYGDPERDDQIKTLDQEEYQRLKEFFTQYPEGRVFEGVVPLSFRVFLPGRMKYALSMPLWVAQSICSCVGPVQPSLSSTLTDVRLRYCVHSMRQSIPKDL